MVDLTRLKDVSNQNMLIYFFSHIAVWARWCLAWHNWSTDLWILHDVVNILCYLCNLKYKFFIMENTRAYCILLHSQLQSQDNSFAMQSACNIILEFSGILNGCYQMVIFTWSFGISLNRFTISIMNTSQLILTNHWLVIPNQWQTSDQFPSLVHSTTMTSTYIQYDLLDIE